MPKQRYQPGQKIGRLTLLARDVKKTKKSRMTLWHVRCDCGKVKKVFQNNLVSNGTRSCGCLNREVARELARRLMTTHGQSKTVEWKTWISMIQRCENKKHPSYKDYGGRGIRVCRRWRNSFVAFLKDVGRRPSSKHSLNRINNNLGYCPSNVNWATREEQQRNKRNNVVLEMKGIKKTAIEWAHDSGMKLHTFYNRLYLGWTLERALAVPVNHNYARIRRKSCQ